MPWLRYGYTPRLTGWLKQHAKDYDAVVINGLWNYASYGSWRALHRLDTPYVVFTARAGANRHLRPIEFAT